MEQSAGTGVLSLCGDLGLDVARMFVLETNVCHPIRVVVDM